jgi:hypothetical protein
MNAMLRQLEYADDGRCLECGLMAMRHRKDCELGALIRDMEDAELAVEVMKARAADCKTVHFNNRDDITEIRIPHGTTKA